MKLQTRRQPHFSPSPPQKAPGEKCGPRHGLLERRSGQQSFDVIERFSSKAETPEAARMQTNLSRPDEMPSGSIGAAG
jgi:hypothetical protein